MHSIQVRSVYLVLLAIGPTGYRSLCRLSSLIQSSPEREHLAVRGLDWEALATHREGLICFSGGRRGWLERLLRAGDEPAARDYARRLANIYGENACLSLELHRPQDEPIAREIVSIGQQVALLPRGRHPDPRRRDRRSIEEIIAGVADLHQQEIIRLAYSLIGQPHHLSVHPGGIVITPGPLTDVVPVQWAPKGRWLSDEFGTVWLQVERLTKIGETPFRSY